MMRGDFATVEIWSIEYVRRAEQVESTKVEYQIIVYLMLLIYLVLTNRCLLSMNEE